MATSVFQPNSVQSQVLDAVTTALGGQSQGAWRCRLKPFGPEELPADNVLPDKVDGQYDTTDQLEMHMQFRIRHTVASAADDVDQVADQRYTRAWKLLMADPTLGGLVRVIRYVGEQWEFESGAIDTAALAVTYEVEFSVSRTDPSIRGY